MGEIYKISLFMNKTELERGDKPDMRGYVCLRDDERFSGFVDDFKLMKKYKDADTSNKAHVVRARRSVYGRAPKGHFDMYITGGELFCRTPYGFTTTNRSKPGKLIEFFEPNHLLDGVQQVMDAIVRFTLVSDPKEREIATNKLNKLPDVSSPELMALWAIGDYSPLLQTE